MKKTNIWYEDRTKLITAIAIAFLLLLGIIFFIQNTKMSDEDLRVVNSAKEDVGERLVEMQAALNSNKSSEEKIQIATVILRDIRERLDEARSEVGNKARKEIVKLQNEISILENELVTSTTTVEN